MSMLMVMLNIIRRRDNNVRSQQVTTLLRFFLVTSRYGSWLSVSFTPHQANEEDDDDVNTDVLLLFVVAFLFLACLACLL